MGMKVHELHAAAVHAPLVLLPAAAMVDFSAAVTGNRRRDALGRKLWWTGIGAAAVAGMAGLAASQEIKADDPHTDDMVWLHGIGNTAILLGAVGIAAWRTGRRASLPQSIIGLAACSLSLFTAYLGGEMVYGRGVGVRAMPRIAPSGVRQSPSVLSAAAPGTFLRDAGRGLLWLLGRTAEVLRGRRRLSRRTLGLEAGPALAGESMH